MDGDVLCKVQCVCDEVVGTQAMDPCLKKKRLLQQQQASMAERRTLAATWRQGTGC